MAVGNLSVLGPIITAVVDASSGGDNTLVAAVDGKRIVVISYYVTSNANITIRFESGTGGTALTGTLRLGTNALYTDSSANGLFETARGTLLNLEQSGAGSCQGYVRYVEA